MNADIDNGGKDLVRRQRSSFLTLAACLALACPPARADDAPTWLLAPSLCEGGLVVHLGCGDGKLTAAVGLGNDRLVHGIDANAANVDAARRHIRSKGLYGRVSADEFDGKHLPYVDNLVNLLVAEDLGGVTKDEALRVLVPGGTLMVRRGRTWQKIYKPASEAIDDWSHHFQGPDNNPVAEDDVIGTPRGLKWSCGPKWSRSHEFLSSISVMVSAEGRLFYVVDEGLTSITDPPIPERWMLVARDAHNGVLLWKKPLANWGAGAWRKRALRATPRFVPHKMIAGGGQVFIILDDANGVSSLDAATGENLLLYKHTAGATQMRYLDGVLLATTKDGSITAVDAAEDDENAGIEFEHVEGAGAVVGKLLWSAKGKVPLGMLAARAGKAYWCAGDRLVCRGLRDGREVWQADAPPKPSLLIVCGDRILLGSRDGLRALSAGEGKTLWEQKAKAGWGTFVVGDRIYEPSNLAVNVRDLATGKMIRNIDPTEVMSIGHHARCYPGKATRRFFISANRGLEFIDLAGDRHSQNDWARGPCTFGILPCNGLVYVPPNPCFCYTGVKVVGFNAFAPAPADAGVKSPTSPRRRQGLEVQGMQPIPSKVSASGDAWPTYRGDGRRAGHTPAKVSPKLKPAWQAELGGRLTQPVVADGRVFVASIDTHELIALDAAGGKAAWRFSAGGRIDSPPTIAGGLLLFGSADGWVYCLDARRGRLLWGFRAAPVDRRIVAMGQLESPWRVHGSVLVEDGVAYVTAGRSTNLDGGIYLYGLDPATGKLLHEAKLDTWSPTRKDAEGKPFIPAYHMEGARSDILSAEGGFLYLGQYKFDRSLRPQPVPYAMIDPNHPSPAMGMKELMDEPYSQEIRTQERDEVVQRNWQLRVWPKLAEAHRRKYGASNLGERTIGRHVFATGGFLDDTWFNRTYWMYSRTWPGFYIANRSAKAGQLLAVDEKNTYAVQAFARRNLQSPLFTPAGRGYLLLADDNENEPVLPDYTRGVPKGIGFTRARPPVWHRWLDIRVRAMASTADVLFAAGPPDVLDADDPMASFEGRKGAVLLAVSKAEGKTVGRYELSAPPVFDGMAATAGRVFFATTDGKVVCMAE